MNVYKNLKTGRLVTLYRAQPRMVSGSWLETEDYFTGEVKRVPESLLRNLALVGTR